MAKKGKNKGAQGKKQELPPPPAADVDDGFDLADELLAALDAGKPQPAAQDSRANAPSVRDPATPAAQPSAPVTPSVLPATAAAGERPSDGTPAGGEEESGAASGRKKSKAKQRLEKRAAQEAATRATAEKEVAELRALNGADPAEKERKEIDWKSKNLGLDKKEISPDGHCLYAAVADQLNLLATMDAAHARRKPDLTYRDTRKAAAATMRADPDSYLPFIDSTEKLGGLTDAIANEDPQTFFKAYCDAVENTAVWGGQLEILALARAYHTPIVVVQSETTPLKIGEEYLSPPAHIAYYRSAYGLGEHYNSLRPHQTQPLSAELVA